MRPRQVLVLCCVHFVQLKIHPAIYTLRLLFGIPQRVTKSQKVHKSSHDGLQSFITPALLNIGSLISQSEGRVVEISSLNSKFVK